MITRTKRGETPNAVTIAAIKELEAPVIFGAEMLDEVIKEPTLDRYLDRSPKLNTDKDYEEMVRLLQRKRAAFITAEQKKREPKVEGEETSEVQD